VRFRSASRLRWARFTIFNSADSGDSIDTGIFNHRLLAFDGKRVTFRWKDYGRDNEWRTMTLPAAEFLRRFVQHILPRRFVRIRQFGYLANACRTARLALARTLLAHPSFSRANVAPSSTPCWRCPRCGALMIVGPILTASQLAAWVRLDSS
jgi:Putative transposase